MPKPKPDQVVRHEVVLGRAEREMLRGVADSYQFNRYASPVVAGLSDLSFVAVVAAILGFGIGGILDRLGLDPDWREITKDMTPEMVKDWLETQNLALGGIGAFLGLLVGGPWGAAAGGVAGGAVAEGLEYVEEQLTEVDSVSRLISWWKGLNLPDWAKDAPLWE